FGSDRRGGRAGNDQFIVRDGNTVVQEDAGAGNDRVFATVTYALTTGAEVEILTTNYHFGTDPLNLTGNELVQFIVGNDGSNILNGGGGADTLWGREGNDQYLVKNGATVITESVGEDANDTLVTTVSYVLTAGAEVEGLATTDAAGTAAINLTGNEFGQSIVGNNGANLLNGGFGNDSLTGNAGPDFFLFN